MSVFEKGMITFAEYKEETSDPKRRITMQGLTEGRIVHYVLPDNDDECRCPGEHRPAVVVKVWDDGYGYDDGVVNLQVFTDYTNDYPRTSAKSYGQVWATSVDFDEDEKLPGTWHWIERA